MTIVPKAWGCEQILHNGDYCAKLLVYTQRKFSSRHYHKRKHETFFVASGVFMIEIGKTIARVMIPGDSVVLEPGVVHRLTCWCPGTIVEASTHDDPDDCFRLEPSQA